MFNNEAKETLQAVFKSTKKPGYIKVKNTRDPVFLIEKSNN
jgi:hypothetical protein